MELNYYHSEEIRCACPRNLPLSPWFIAVDFGPFLVAFPTGFVSSARQNVGEGSNTYTNTNTKRRMRKRQRQQIAPKLWYELEQKKGELKKEKAANRMVWRAWRDGEHRKKPENPVGFFRLDSRDRDERWIAFMICALPCKLSSSALLMCSFQFFYRCSLFAPIEFCSSICVGD